MDEERSIVVRLYTRQFQKVYGSFPSLDLSQLSTGEIEEMWQELIDKPAPHKVQPEPVPTAFDSIGPAA